MPNKISEANNFFDLNSLNSIRQKSRKTDGESKDAALKQAAQQFEAIFMQMLLKSMRSAQDVLESDSPFNSQSTKFYRDMHDQQLAVELSSNGSLGLSELIVRQLGGDNENFTPKSVLRTGGEFSGDFSQLKAIDNRQNATSLNHQNIDSTSLSNKSSSTSFKLMKDMMSSESPQVESVTFEQPKDFVSALTEPAKNIEDKLGIPFQVVIAQAALETGWGQKIIKTEQGNSSNNLFNIKADQRWQGKTTKTQTLEFEQGAMIKKTEPFRVYDSLVDSANDYVDFLSSNPRYQKALQQVDKVEQFLHGLQSAGYATDPKYAEKIIGTLKRVSELLYQAD